MQSPIAIVKSASNDDTAASGFAVLYRRLIEFLKATFPPGDNEHCPYPPVTAQEFVTQRFARAPELQRHFAREMWTLLREIERNDRMVNGKRLHDHQFAHLIWLAATVVGGESSPTSFFIQGAPGTGKTLTLGVLMQACIRLQKRQLLTGKIAYCTAKPYHLSSKVRGKGMGQRRVLRTPPYAPTDKDVNRRRLALSRMDARFMKQFFPRKAWTALFTPRYHSESEAREIVESYLKDHDLHVGDSDQAMLANVIKVLAAVATTVRGLDGATELLTLPPVPEANEEIVSHTGDAAFAIPSDYPVFARENIGVSTTTRSDAHVVLEPVQVFTSSRQIERHQDELHRHIQVILCDEAQRKQPIAFQEPVVGAGAERIPLVFAVGSQWYGKAWDCRSPMHSFPESIRRGILPDIGVRLFPGADGIHFPSETEESIEQLRRIFFQPLESFKQLKLPQPFDTNSLVVVHGRLVDQVVEQLRRSYAGRGEHASVRPFHGNEEDREALQIWFDSISEYPRVLVSSAAIVKESLDLHRLRHLVVGTKVSADVLYHLIGRLAHGRDRLKPVDRMLLTIQQFANSNLAATPFVALDHGQALSEEGFEWVHGQALMSDRAFRRDSRQLKPLLGSEETVLVPSHARRKRGMPLPISMEPGISLLPKTKGERIDPRKTPSTNGLASRLALTPAQETYDPGKGPPTRELVRSWACECDGFALFETYPSIMLVVEEAHSIGEDPRLALEHKIARLRERSNAMSAR